MTRQALVLNIAKAIAEREGFFVTRQQAKSRTIAFPTRAQKNANPGNLRAWRDANRRSYPVKGGYVDFVGWAWKQYPEAWADGLMKKALDEGWRVLQVLVGQYLDGQYTGGKTPTFFEMFRVYAPASDSNDPDGYARFVAARLGMRPDQRLSEALSC